MTDLLLLDPNIVIHLIRDNAVGRRVDDQIWHRSDRPLIPIVTIGECLSLARQFGWGATRIQALEAAE